jgi:PAS domain S-box-containing protein
MTAPLHPKQPVQVLLVDDEPDLLEIGKIFLEKGGEFQVTVNSSASSCIDLIKSAHYDVIVSDYQMPRMDGIEFLKEVRESGNIIPFILFTGRGREEVVIEAINKGVTFYMQKGGEINAQYAELSHKIHRAVGHYRSESTLRETNEMLNAILAASPNGIGLVRERTFQWVNYSLSQMLGYSSPELIGVHLRSLYENEETYRETGEQIVKDLKDNGRSMVTTRFLHKQGFAIDCEIHIAPLDKGNLHYGHMIMMTDISRKLAAARELKDIAAFPHLELTPVIELNMEGRITYFNDASIGDLIKYGNGARLESFIPKDIHEILAGIDQAELHSVYRTVKVGNTRFRVHITLSSRFRIARISAVRIIKEPKESLG